MTVMGFVKADFKGQDGNLVKGCNLFLTYELPENGQGVGCEAFGHNPVYWALTVAYWLLVLLRIFAPMMGLVSLGTKLLSVGFWMALPIFLVLSLIKQALDKAMQVYILDMRSG